MENNNSGEHKTNDDRLTDIFSSVGRQYRLTDVTAQFVAFRDLKIKLRVIHNVFNAAAYQQIAYCLCSRLGNSDYACFYMQT